MAVACCNRGLQASDLHDQHPTHQDTAEYTANFGVRHKIKLNIPILAGAKM